MVESPVAIQEHQQAHTKEAFITTIEQMVTSGVDMAVAADFDENISQPKEHTTGVDPRDSEIHPVIRQAFTDILASGRDVVIVSSRGAQDVKRIANIDGISVVGTLGWETLDRNGNSQIHPKFRPFQPQITGILSEVREKFFAEQLHRTPDLLQEPNSELITPTGGTIILQRKGYNEEYPEGINATWSLSMVSDEERQSYQQALTTYYNESFEKHTVNMSEEEKTQFAQLCGLMFRDGMTAHGQKTFDVEIRPTAQGAKAQALIQLMRDTGDEKGLEHYKNMPHHAHWIFSGDHAVQDIAAMQAGHRAHAFTKGARGVLGVWSRSPHEKEQTVPAGVDIVVDSVAGNAQLLKETATVFCRNPISA